MGCYHLSKIETGRQGEDHKAYRKGWDKIFKTGGPKPNWGYKPKECTCTSGDLGICDYCLPRIGYTIMKLPSNVEVKSDVTEKKKAMVRDWKKQNAEALKKDKDYIDNL